MADFPRANSVDFSTLFNATGKVIHRALSKVYTLGAHLVEFLKGVVGEVSHCSLIFLNVFTLLFRNPIFKVSQIAAEFVRLIEVPGVARLQMESRMIVNRFQNLMDWRVPALSHRIVPLAWHHPLLATIAHPVPGPSTVHRAVNICRLYFTLAPSVEM